MPVNLFAKFHQNPSTFRGPTHMHIYFQGFGRNRKGFYGEIVIFRVKVLLHNEF